MGTPEPFVIIGAGLAGAKAAEALREAGHTGPVTLIGEEAEAPYERPPLSKDYLTGAAAREKMLVHPHPWYAEHDIDLLPDTTAAGIDPARCTVALADGRAVGYERLLLATGARPRRLAVPGADADGVFYLRRVGDCERLKDLFRSAPRIAVVGGGWIGLEVAAAARSAGLAVTVLERDALPLERVLGPEIARVFAELHVEHGVDVRTGATVAEILTSGGRAAGVRLVDGTRIEADAVIVGIGAVPNAELAAAADLGTEDGIVVDASLRTSDPHIYAAGDVALAYHPLLGRSIRVEHWDNARKQGAAAAQAMLGHTVVYDRVPYFYTDQYDLGMEYAGFLEPGTYDRLVVRGDLQGRKFLAFWLTAGRVAAGMNVNIWDVNRQIQQLVRSGQTVGADALADPRVPLEQLAAA